METPSQPALQTKAAPVPASGQFDGVRHLFPLRVYYEDTDLSGVVYHANYLRFLERARSDLLRLLGIDQRAAIEAAQGSYAVVDMALKFVSPAKLDDALMVETSVQELKAATVTLAQGVMLGDKVLATGTVRVAFVTPEGRPTRQPLAWRKKFEPYFAPISNSMPNSNSRKTIE